MVINVLHSLIQFMRRGKSQTADQLDSETIKKRNDEAHWVIGGVERFVKK